MNRVKRTRFWLLKPTQKSKNIQYSTVKLYCDIFTISFWFAVLLWVDIPCMSVMSLNGMCAYQEVKNVFFFWKNLRTYLLDGTLSNRQVIVRKCLNGSFKNDVNGRQGEGVTKYVDKKCIPFKFTLLFYYYLMPWSLIMTVRKWSRVWDSV